MGKWESVYNKSGDNKKLPFVNSYVKYICTQEDN